MKEKPFSERISALKGMLLRFVTPTRSASFIKPWDGKPAQKGSLFALCSPEGGGKTEWVMKVLEENTSLKVAWIEKELTIYPPAFEQRKISLDRILFVEAGEQEMGSASHCIRSQLFDLVVVHAESLCEMDLRRLQLAAERTQASVILLMPEPLREGSWPVTEQLSVLWNGLNEMGKNGLTQNGLRGVPCVSYA